MEPQPVRQVFQVEIRTRDLEKAIAFYGGIFDWAFVRTGSDYALVDTGHLPIASIMQTKDPEFPLGVCNLVLVEDCQKEAERAVELGGSIVVRKWEVPGSGWFTGTVDPWGNEIFFWQSRVPARPKPSGAHTDRIALLEIPVADMAAGVAYYSKLLGWTFDGVSFRHDYVFMQGAGLEGGVALIGGDLARAAKRAIDYVEVADLDAAMAKVGDGGGRVLVGPVELEGDNRYLIFEDPEGNRMGILQTRPKA